MSEKSGEAQGFVPSVEVKVGEADCTDIQIRSSSSLVCKTPPHALGTVDIRVLNSEGEQAALTDAYTYRPSGDGMTGFGILAIAPLQGTYADPFSTTLDSTLTGFDVATLERSWRVNGRTYKEGDTVAFGVGTHTVTLTVEDVTGDKEVLSHTIVVGPGAGPVNPAQASETGSDELGGAFALAEGESISLANAGLSPLVNPRLVGAGRPDYVDWPRYLKSLARLNNLRIEASESSRFALIEAAWKDLAISTVHICAPGRESEEILDPVMIVRGYGYECCFNVARALANLAVFLDIPSRIRATAHHVYPEFSVGGRMFLLDPDMRVRFWSESGAPLTAWTTADAPESLENVTHYFAETPDGGYYEVHSGGDLPYSILSEPAFLAHYIDTIGRGEDIFPANREAFSSFDYVLYPHEKLVFDRVADYVPLQWMLSDGVPDGGAFAPPVGKALLRMLWSSNGPRSFATDDDGNSVISLGGLPYPVQDLTFYFNTPVQSQDAWLVAAGQSYRIGQFAGNTWIVSAQELRTIRDVTGLAAVIPGTVKVVAVEAGMQFNPGVFGDVTGTASLTYADDSGDCARQLRVVIGSDVKSRSFGSSRCETRAPLRVKRSYSLMATSPDVSVISDYGSSRPGAWGLVAPAGVRSYAEIALPRTPGLPAILRANTPSVFADWQIYDGSTWTPTADLRISQWLSLPATTSPTTRLRLTLRQALGAETTYLDYLSLLEGHDVDFFAVEPSTATH